MRHSVFLALVCVLSGCHVFSPPSPPAPDTGPAIVLPGSGVVTLPTARPTRTPQAPPSPTAVPSRTPAPAVSNPCPTPPPGVCCGIVFGSIQGTVKDPDGQFVPNATVTLRTVDGSLLGGCSNKATVSVMAGSYAFNAVPFNVAVVIEATAPGYERFEQTLGFAKGPIFPLDIVMKRST